MDFTALDLAPSALPATFLLAGWAGLAWLAWRWAKSGDWRRLAEPARLNLFLGATVALLALWQIRTGVKPGLAFHLYGIAALTLMFGFWRAVASTMLILLANVAFGHGNLASVGVDAFMLGVVPAWVSWNVQRILERRLPNHFFIYVLGNGFFGAMLSVAAIGLTVTAVMTVSGAYRLDYLLGHYTPYVTVLVGWGEAFMTGMAVTLMAVYRPAWLESFDDERYLRNK